jgi:hypothetical protein
MKGQKDRSRSNGATRSRAAQPDLKQRNRSPSSATGHRAAQPVIEQRNHFPNNIEHLDDQCMGHSSLPTANAKPIDNWYILPLVSLVV